MRGTRERLEAHADACRQASAAGRSRPGLVGGDLCNADLRGADLSDAYLHGADLSDAYLRGANLRGAHLHGADLCNADLRGADLSDAYLHGAGLSYAYLHGADLSDACLRGANLRGANLRGADLGDADLRDADLRNADLRGAIGADDVPRAPMAGLAAAVLGQLTERPETWDQGVWHSDCGTAHCCAGWAVVLAGDLGLAAELRLGTHTAAKMLLGGTDHPFGAGDHDRVIPWLQARVAEEAGQ